MNNRIVETALRSLGRGFDLTSDFRLKYCKGKERLVLLNEDEKKELMVPGFGVFKDVSIDVKCDKGDRTRYQSDVLEFNKMSEFFNQKSSIPGKIPSGLFNAMFGFDAGTWAEDEANTKYLGLDGYFIILFDVHIDRFPLVLSEEVRNAVPSSWDPWALARFIERYGTHVIVGLAIGGQDVVLVRQDYSSSVGPSELKQHLDNLGDQLFTGTCNFSPNSRENKHKAPPQAFDLFCDTQPIGFNNFTSIATKDGISVKSVKRGGDPSITDHLEWLPTVQKSPDAIHFSFIPITSLLIGVPGKGFLSHAINLYLRYKPPISELHYFLDFQFHKGWAPIHNDLPLGPTTNISSSSPALHFNFLGPKLYVNTTMVISGNRPVTGMRLFLEGMKCNRLAIHLQHLSNTPTMLENKIDINPLWQGSEDTTEPGYLEPVSRRKFSHVCTAPVEFHPRWNATKDEANIVTGAQLHVKRHDSKSVLHLRLSFSKVSDCDIVHSNWDRCYSEFSQKSASLFSAISTSLSGSPSREKPKQLVVVDSSVFPAGPPVPVQTQKLLKFVDTSQVCRGPQDTPGHWLVTGARLHLENGKICLLVKFSLLNICSNRA